MSEPQGRFSCSTNSRLLRKKADGTLSPVPQQSTSNKVPNHPGRNEMQYSCIALSTMTILMAPIAYAQDAKMIVQNPQDVIDIAAKSQCAQHSWNKGRQGIAPSGYIKGVGLLFAKDFCESKSGNSEVTQVMSGPLSDASVDALTEYAKLVDAKLPTGSALERLETDYGILLGLGMVESSGRTTISAPFDSANPHPSAQTAEAGLYQTSANSLKSNTVLPRLQQDYLAHKDSCEFDVFTNNKHPKLTPAIGTGDGVDFQQLTKSCPGFATEYAAVMIRVKRTHYGTLNIRSAEYAPSCVPMFKSIEAAVKCDGS